MRRDYEYDCYTHPGIEHFGAALEVFRDSVRLDRVAWN